MGVMTIGAEVNIVLLFLLVIVALAVVHVKNLITSTILLGVFSLIMAAQYLVLGAADVAITEAAVGAGISTVLFLLTLFLVGDFEIKSKKNNLIPIIVVILVGSVLIYTTFSMPSFGNLYSPAQLHVAPYYWEQAPVETGIPNMVTSILASYRGFDTLGETGVVFTAALAVILLLGRFKKTKKEEK